MDQSAEVLGGKELATSQDIIKVEVTEEAKVRKTNMITFSNVSPTVNVHPLIRNLFPKIKGTEIPLAGRLKEFSKQWEKITNDRSILKHSTRLGNPLLVKSPPNSPSKRDKNECSRTETNVRGNKEYVGKGSHKICKSYKRTISEQRISKREKKKAHFDQSNLNLRELNSFIPYHHFKMESLKNLKDLLKQWDLMCKLDLKDAYFTVPLGKQSQKYVRFL